MLEERRHIGLSANDDHGVEDKVREIIEKVRCGGLDAVLDYTRKFDSENFTPDMLAVSREDIRKAYESTSADDLRIIGEAADNIRNFHQAQKDKSWFVTRPDGTMLGQTINPVGRAGLYVPGGRRGNTPLISSLLMTAIPAQVAGVGEIAVVTPPRADGSVNPYILAAAELLGIREIYACGSAWAIAALAHGAGPIRPVDVIAGPGNIWVATAKRLLIGQVGIDMIAGPSEVLILADDTASPAVIAADMLSQAEHDSLASAICVITSSFLAESIKYELETQCATLPRAEVARESLRRWGAVVIARDLEHAIGLANRVAPEHLELLCERPWEVLPKIKSAGAVFMGAYSAESLGDYYAGPNHVLPTMGTARFASALGVQTFCKKTSVIAASAGFARDGAAAVARLARLEGLEAHARAAEARLKI
ncbi:histidinol dehydrogenase [Desulfovibrio sp. OttesenSCG-928-C06]|nr:histidinol dehydrogenase [Desulfovibrio sp. OttesenSCG-928-C06]